jgi:type IV secretory pathway VirB4 component
MDGHRRDYFRGLFERLFSSLPFEQPVDNCVDGPIRIGKVKGTEASCGLNLPEINQHALVVGRVGSGKTTLLCLMMIQLYLLGIPFWAFDFKQDYRHLLNQGINVYVFNLKKLILKINPLRGPRGCDPREWLQVIIDVFLQSYDLRAGSESILMQHGHKLCRDYGVFEGKDVYPTMLDLKDSIDAYVPERSYGRISDFLDSVKTRLNDCILALGEMFDCDKGFSLEDLLDKPVVFELEGLLPRHQKFLVSMILKFIYHYRISNGHRGHLRHVLFFDEAKMVYDKKSDLIRDLGPSEMTQITTLIREFGEALVVSDQMPTDLSNAIKASVYTTICMSQSGGPNIQEMGKALDLDKDQISYMTQLVSEGD